MHTVNKTFAVIVSDLKIVEIIRAAVFGKMPLHDCNYKSFRAPFLVLNNFQVLYP